MRMAPMISRRSPASGWRRAIIRDRLVVDLALRFVEDGVIGDDLARKRQIGMDQRRHRLVDHAFGLAAHRRNLARQEFQLVVIGADDVMRWHDGHGSMTLPRISRGSDGTSKQINNPAM